MRVRKSVARVAFTLWENAPGVKKREIRVHKRKLKNKYTGVMPRFWNKKDCETKSIAILGRTESGLARGMLRSTGHHRKRRLEHPVAATSGAIDPSAINCSCGKKVHPPGDAWSAVYSRHALLRSAALDPSPLSSWLC